MQKELKDLSPDELGKLFPIILSDHNPQWPLLYRTEKNKLEKALGSGNIISIEHIGSTAVPNLISKPTIDTLIQIPEKTDKQHIIEQITNIGYQYIPQPDNPAPHMMFAKGYTKDGFKGQAYHIHVRYSGDWDEPYFRDYLTQNPGTASEYAKLKQELAVKYRNNRDGYTNAKTEFIQRITKMARKQLSVNTK